MRYFLSIIGILEFCDFVIYPRINTSILYSVFFKNSGKILFHP